MYINSLLRWGETVSLELCPLTGPLSIPQMTHEWIWSSGGMILTGENRRTRRKSCPGATLCITNPTWTDLAVRSRWLTAWASHGAYRNINKASNILFFAYNNYSSPLSAFPFPELIFWRTFNLLMQFRVYWLIICTANPLCLWSFPRDFSCRINLIFTVSQSLFSLMWNVKVLYTFSLFSCFISAALQSCFCVNGWR
jgi:hypothetical protein